MFEFLCYNLPNDTKYGETGIHKWRKGQFPAVETYYSLGKVIIEIIIVISEDCHLFQTALSKKKNSIMCTL